MQTDLAKAIEIRQRYSNNTDYILSMQSQHCTRAYVFDGWLGKQHEERTFPSHKPERPANYKMLDEHWELVDIEKDFEGNPTEKIVHLVVEEELYYIPIIGEML